ncbi:hypothetical protein AQJ23_01815 [Streptomyces antibioticus]|nr:hypothetical protein AQJ23_01815 [Streptomyces antibioticus]
MHRGAPPSRPTAPVAQYTLEDPEGTTTGRDAIADKAADLLANAPADFEFSEDGRRYAGPDTGALAWAFGPPGTPAVRGIDVITVRDGRIAALLTMFTA